MCEVRIRGAAVPMSLPRLQMLAHLIRAGGRVVPREELYRYRGTGLLPPRSRAIDVHMVRIRQALGDLGRFIVAVPRRGYRIDVFGLSQLA
jgi:DNA-binding response OmpR family regulator